MTNFNFEEMNENMNKMGQSAYNAAKALYTMNTNTVEQLFDQQIAMATLCMESITSQMELMSTAKGYQAVVAGQADIAKVPLVHVNANYGFTRPVVRETAEVAVAAGIAVARFHPNAFDTVGGLRLCHLWSSVR